MKENKNTINPKVTSQQSAKKIPLKEKSAVKASDFALGKQNYILLALGAAFIILDLS